jgi:hypothetical protein
VEAEEAATRDAETLEALETVMQADYEASLRVDTDIEIEEVKSVFNNAYRLSIIDPSYVNEESVAEEAGGPMRHPRDAGFFPPSPYRISV